MNPALVITYAGFTGTLRQWAARRGLKLNTLTSRIERGMPFAKALDMPTQRPKHLTPAKVLEYQGEKGTIVQWAERIGLSECGLRYRLYRGRSIEEALTSPPHKMPALIYPQLVKVQASSRLRCFFCGRPISEWKSRKHTFGVFIGVRVPVCGDPECNIGPHPSGDLKLRATSAEMPGE